MADLFEEVKQVIEPGTEPARGNKKHGFINPLVADIIGGVSSLLVGGVTAWQLISERAYKNMSSLYLFEKMKSNRFKSANPTNTRVQSTTIAPQEAYTGYRQMIREYGTEAEKLMEGAGLGTMRKKFGILRPHQKAEVVITAAAYGGIALGSVLLVTRGLFTKEQQKELAEKGSPDTKAEHSLSA